MRIFVTLFSIVTLQAAACGTSIEEKGGPGQDCFGDGTCDQGLSCIGEVCCSAQFTRSYIDGPELTSGPSPVAIEAVDLNGDGISDLAVLNNSSSQVRVLLGNGSGGTGDGTFQDALAFDVGDVPFGIVVDDFNADQVPDIATSNMNSEDVSVLIGQGDGTFSAASTYQVGGDCRSIALGDFNADGSVDMAVSRQMTASGMAVLLNNSDGTFVLDDIYAADKPTVCLAAGDINRDQILDLVAAGTNYELLVFLGNGSGGVGDGTFTVGESYPAGQSTTCVDLGDFDEDGNLDAAIASWADGDVWIFLGQGNGSFSFSDKFQVGQGANSVLVRDMDADGHEDITAVCVDTASANILFGRGDGTFEPKVNLTVNQGPNWAAAADFNGDGVSDIAVVNTQAGNISVFFADLMCVERGI
jgi:hypothetical protein